MARQETELELVKLTHLGFPRPAAANNAPTDPRQPISKCMSVTNTTSRVDPYLSARKASNRNDHFLLDSVLFRFEINEQINRRNEKRCENRLNVLLGLKFLLQIIILCSMAEWLLLLACF